MSWTFGRDGSNVQHVVASWRMPNQVGTDRKRETMRLPIDTTSLTFIAVNAPAPLLDHDTKVPKLDSDNRPVFAVGVVALGADGADVLVVKVAGEPKGIAQASLVNVVGLIATTWQMGDRHGVSFKADAIIAAGAPAAPAAGKPSS